MKLASKYKLAISLEKCLVESMLSLAAVWVLWFVATWTEQRTNIKWQMFSVLLWIFVQTVVNTMATLSPNHHNMGLTILARVVLGVLLLDVGIALLTEVFADHEPTFDPFYILGVDRCCADFKAIKRAYRNLSLRYHPDWGSKYLDAEQESNFSLIVKAYETLYEHWEDHGNLDWKSESEPEALWEMDRWPGLVLMQIVALFFILWPRESESASETKSVAVETKNLSSIIKKSCEIRVNTDDEGGNCRKKEDGITNTWEIVETMPSSMNDDKQ